MYYLTITDCENKKINFMNVKQAKILLEKINRLFQSMTMDDHISEIEKELMRNYIKQMYEEFMPDNAATAAPIAPPPVVQKPKVVAPPVVREVVAPPRVQTIETPPPPPPPKVEVAPEPVVVPAPAPVPVAKAAPVAKPKVAKPEPVKVTPTKRASKSKISEEHEELFEQKEATELSEKLSLRPLKDLRKAMGINERILTTNELFDGNGDALKDTLTTLNNLNTFDEAKDYLSNIAGIYNWTSRKKKKKAQIFVKMVRRKFL